ncbi:galactosyltransferase-domain-containing protein [Sporodiniella umbellata]|nr:galactosyltransferase-domain-containing protein [Sporodiniella umbellata]
MAKPNKLPKQPRFYFWRKTLSLSDLNLPRHSKITVDALRTLSLLPSFFGWVYNWKQALQVPLRDAGGAVILQCSQLDYVVASFWCALAGYWNWILTTSMMRRWIYHYETGNAIVRLITFIVITWSISAFVSSQNGPDQPIRTWMINCFILLITDIIRLSIVSDPKYHGKNANVKDPNLFLKLTITKVLIIPMAVASCLSVFAVLIQIDQLHYATSQLMTGPVLLDREVQTGHSGSLLVLVMSCWSLECFERRQALRKTVLALLGPLRETEYRFILGQPPSARSQMLSGFGVMNEAKRYQDMILVQSSDAETDKSRKVFEAMVWAQRSNYDYIAKVDDNVFVRWDKIYQELSEMKPIPYYWKGLTYRNIPIHILASYKTLRTDYALPAIPAYTHGMLYLFSRDILGLILSPSSPKRFVHGDGENFSIWLFGFHIQPVHDRRIHDAYDTCENDLIGKRVKETADLFKIYKNLQEDKPLCTGFDSFGCAPCYPCKNKRTSWRTLNLACDPLKGITLREMVGFPHVAGRILNE